MSRYAIAYNVRQICQGSCSLIPCFAEPGGVHDRVVVPPMAVQQARFLVSRDPGMRYTSNDAQRGITSIAARTGVYICVCVYVRLMRGQDAWPASRPASGALLSLDLARSCLLVAVRSMLLFSRSKTPSGPALLNAVARAHYRRRGTVRGTASPFSPRPAI